MLNESITQGLRTALQAEGVATVADLAELKTALLSEIDLMLKGTSGGDPAGGGCGELPSGDVSDEARLAMKRALAHAFWKNVKQRQLTQQQVAERVGMARQKVSDLMRQNVVGLSERKILECLVRIGCDVEIVVRPGSGQIKVTTGESE